MAVFVHVGTCVLMEVRVAEGGVVLVQVAVGGDAVGGGPVGVQVGVLVPVIVAVDGVPVGVSVAVRVRVGVHIEGVSKTGLSPI